MQDERSSSASASSLRPDWIDDVTSLPMTVALALPTGVLYICVFFLMPRIEQVLKDFKIELPTVSVLSLGLVRWMSSWGWSVVWLLPLLLPILLTQLSRAHGPVPLTAGRVLWGINLGLMLCLLVILWFALAVLLPWVSLIQSVNTPSPR